MHMCNNLYIVADVQEDICPPQSSMDIHLYIYIYIHMHYTCRHICVKSHMWHLEEEGLRPPDLSPCI